MDMMYTDSSLLLYQTEDGQTKIEVHLQDETVWLSQAQLCELFDKDKRTISEHIQNIFKEGELFEESVIRKFRTTASDGKNYQVNYYNLDVIISVGYRVSSHRGTQFRIWATQRLKEYLIKGFTLDDERLKRSSGGNYFSELLARIRDIRSSEKVFWRKVLDIYATSIDYDPKTESSKQFFAIVQNKMHWAAHGHTAAEIIYSRANAGKTNMGLTSWSGKKPNHPISTASSCSPLPPARGKVKSSILNGGTSIFKIRSPTSRKARTAALVASLFAALLSLNFSTSTNTVIFKNH